MTYATHFEYLRAFRKALGEGRDLAGNELIRIWSPLYQRTWQKDCPGVIFYDDWDSFFFDANDAYNLAHHSWRDSKIEYDIDTEIDDGEYVEFVQSLLQASVSFAGPKSRQFIEDMSENSLRDCVAVVGAMTCWPAIARMPYYVRDYDDGPPSNGRFLGETIMDRSLRLDRQARKYRNSDDKKVFCQQWFSAINSVWAAAGNPDALRVLRWPKYVHIDPNSELSCPDGPAIEMPNGRHHWFLHGHELPHGFRTAKERNSKTIAELLTLEDIALRDVLCADYGWARIAEQIGVIVVEDSGDPIWGKLVDMWIPGGSKRFLDVLCGTGRRMLVPVADRVRSVNEAQEALHGGTPFWMLRTAARRT